MALEPFPRQGSGNFGRKSRPMMHSTGVWITAGNATLKNMQVGCVLWTQSETALCTMQRNVLRQCLTLVYVLDPFDLAAL